MNDLRRDLAPVSDAAWAQIEAEAVRTLKTTLAARKLVDFTGPLGWEASAIGVGRTDRLEAVPE
ncbi:MAG TPA: family 1 encapsulin nanocompartment shell protein, partial [Casimicrobiaceae bacterium]|nr:family 1 encapsulin nanocompartment shell protein [Casimicrobiaceae bacterium]